MARPMWVGQADSLPAPGMAGYQPAPRVLSLSSWRFDGPEILGERPFRVHPLLDADKARLARQIAYPSESEFMPPFRPHGLALPRREIEIRSRVADKQTD